MCVSDSEADNEQTLPSELDVKKLNPKAPRHSNRGSARKRFNYSTRHHPQDKQISGFGRKRAMHSEDDDADARSYSAKRGKMVK